MIQLDTSFLIRGLIKGSTQDAQLRHWIRLGEGLAMSSIAWAEFQCGPVDEKTMELASHVVTERLPFAEHHAALAARLFNHSGRRRGAFVDCMIAATALAEDAPLATTNVDDFIRFASQGLRLANEE
ncbi:MAG: hypothetical protein A2289_24255 [Deltaproteobacteria bacterium RIFOXYA12_FULL_58_15]|nr:MAG: hypothetical protein A2289_24255 [Deltaproteobacteria bacterium RIFOXYA12_FULL_58_15]OGR15278.1 MAG: hypothetical protein A2341_23275 [Deltaproteobacteria bacterium RIFOXYB12_FULL_58_9]